MELRAFVLGAAEIVGVQLCLLLIGCLTLMKLGRLGALELAAASLGQLSFNVLGQMLCNAPMFALDEIAPQAWGAGRHAEVGLATQRAVLLAFSLIALCLLVWPSVYSILVALQQPPEVAALAAQYMHYSIAALPLGVLFAAAQRFCYAQGVRWPPLAAACVGTASQLLWQELLVGAFGFVGGPLSLTCTIATMNVALLLIMRAKAPTDPRAWPGLQGPAALLRDRRAARRFVWTSVAALLSLTEWLFWEFVCFRVGAQPMAVHRRRAASASPLHAAIAAAAEHLRGRRLRHAAAGGARRGVRL